jgi:putative membrane protein
MSPVFPVPNTSFVSERLVNGSIRMVPVVMALMGAGLLVVLILGTGLDAVRDALAPVGWGIVPIILSHALPMLLDMAAWRLLFLGSAPSPGALFGMRWIGEAVNNLLPVAQVGGELARVRLAMLAGVETSRASATVLADVTFGALTQMLFALIGLGLLLTTHQVGSVIPVLSGLLLFGCGIYAFYWIQRGRGLGMVWRWAGVILPKQEWVVKLGEIGPFQETLERIYADRAVAGWSCFWRLAGWFAGAAEIWLCLWFFGVPVGWTDVIILESLSQAGRSAAFTVPGAIGVQEAGFVALGMVLGLDPSTALALGLIRRARDLALGLPALAVWSGIEARRSAAAIRQDGAR